EVDKTTCDFPCEVTITNTSSSFAQTFFWDFGDGDTLQANDAEPLKHTFAEPGNYTISLQVECADGELSSVAAKTVSVIDPTAPPTC
ncbi:MAG: PKD domain-containing protein, partial [Saprospiraceae bacterium]|nr:PKD domain-containing protein [Saprospiraceae bacterium]